MVPKDHKQMVPAEKAGMMCLVCMHKEQLQDGEQRIAATAAFMDRPTANDNP